MKREPSAPQIQRNYAYWENQRSIEILEQEISLQIKKLKAMDCQLKELMVRREELKSDETEKPIST